MKAHAVRPSFVIRDAIPADARGIAEAHVGSWRTTYRGHFPDALLDEQDMDRWTSDRERLIRDLPADQSYLVADVDGHVAGFAVGGPARDASEDAEVYAIYLLQEYQRRGIGAALLRECVRRFRRRGWTSMVIWVLRENAIGRGFYERMGGVADREKQDVVGRTLGRPHEITETAYVWRDLAVFG